MWCWKSVFLSSLDGIAFSLVLRTLFLQLPVFQVHRNMEPCANQPSCHRDSASHPECKGGELYRAHSFRGFSHGQLAPGQERDGGEDRRRTAAWSMQPGRGCTLLGHTPVTPSTEVLPPNDIFSSELTNWWIHHQGQCRTTQSPSRSPSLNTWDFWETR